MRWRMPIFIVLRSRPTAIVVLVILTLALLAATALQVDAHREFTLIVSPQPSNLAESVKVTALSRGFALQRTVSDTTPIAVFPLQRGDYLIEATANSAGRNQDWRFRSATISVHGTVRIVIGGGYDFEGHPYPDHNAFP